MKTRTHILFLILVSATLYGQDLTGEWKGTLQVQGNPLSVIFHVNKINQQYEATMDSPSQNVTGIKVTASQFNYPNVTLEVGSIGAVYEGVLSDKSMTGKWLQSGTAFFLELLKTEEAGKRK